MERLKTKKMKCLVLISSLLFTSCSFSQSYLKVFPGFLDKDVVDKFSRDNKIKEYIVYQVGLVNNQFIRTEVTDSVASFLIWKQDKQYFMKMIKKNYIFSTERIDSIDIFLDPSLPKVGATKTEGTLDFVPPGLIPFESEIVICNQNGKEFFFESGLQHYYKEDENKKKDRLRISEMLNRAARRKLSSFKKETSYKRIEILD